MSDKEREKKEERKNGDNVQREKEREKRMGEPALRTYYLEMAPLKRFCDLFIYIYNRKGLLPVIVRCSI